MARLPDPITDNIMVQWPDETEWKKGTKTLFSMLAETVRKAEFKKKREGDGKEV